MRTILLAPVLALSLAYLGLLFAVAYFGDRYAREYRETHTVYARRLRPTSPDDE